MKNSMIENARKEYIERRDRKTHPDGEFDRGGRWYPSTKEKRSCCNNIRSPSRAFPYSLMVHCRTAVHVANLYHVRVEKVKKNV